MRCTGNKQHKQPLCEAAFTYNTLPPPRMTAIWLLSCLHCWVKVCTQSTHCVNPGLMWAGTCSVSLSPLRAQVMVSPCG